MKDEEGQAAVLSRSKASQKAKWSVRLILCAVALLLCPCVLLILREAFIVVTGTHVHPHARLFEFALFGCVIAGVGLSIGAGVCGFLALKDIRASATRFEGRGEAIAAISMAAVLVVLVAAALPVVWTAREAARWTQCKCNLKQLGLAFHNYHDAFKCFPPYAICDADGKPLLSWRVTILPFIEESDLYDQFHLNEPWDSSHNLPLAARMPVQFRCPSDPSSAENAPSYVIVTGPGTFFPLDGQTTIKDVKDGASLTVMAGEVVANTVPWTKPADLSFDESVVGRGEFSSGHGSGWQVLMGDGTCRFIREETDPTILRAIMTIAGGELVDEDDF